MVYKVIFNTLTTSIIQGPYHWYLDTKIKLDKSIYRISPKIYDPSDKDLFEQYAKEADTHLKRKVSDEHRYLYIINLSEKEIVSGIAKLFGFTFEFPEDERTILVENENIYVIDYTPKSVAAFPRTEKGKKILGPFMENLKFNTRLTGLSGKKESGYILAKSSKIYSNFLESLSRENTNNDEIEEIEEIEDPSDCYHENGIKQIEDLSGSEKCIFEIWGDSTFIEVRLTGLVDDGDGDISYTKLSEKKLKNNRKVVTVELKSN